MPIEIDVADRYGWEKIATIPPLVTSTARQISQLMVDVDIPHVIVGGLAVSLYGYHRATSDVDFLVPDDARSFIESLGPTKPISGYLSGLSVEISGIDVDFLFLSKGITVSDISHPTRIAGFPVVPIATLVALKLGAGRRKDEADIVELLKLGKIPADKVEKELTGESKEDFLYLQTLADLENQGRHKEAKRLRR